MGIRRWLLALSTIVIFLTLGGFTSSVLAAPQVTICFSSGPAGTIFTAVGTGFTPNSTVTSHLKKPNGIEFPTLQLNTDSAGNYTKDINSSSFALGTYRHWAIDNTTSQWSNTASFKVTTGATTDSVQYMLCRINEIRRQAKLNQLSNNTKLKNAAAWFAKDCPKPNPPSCYSNYNDSGYHRDHLNRCPQARCQAYGYTGTASEIVFISSYSGKAGVDRAINWWMNSSAHRGTILKSNLKVFGGGIGKVSTSACPAISATPWVYVVDFGNQ